jgi:high-affinity iron transporter
VSGVFLQAAGILIREGLEAILVIAALAAYLAKVGARARLPALYGGAGVGVLASVAAAWTFERFYGGAHDDLMEGVIILAAAALMLYVSGWLLVRQDPRAWQVYLQQKADRALERRTVIAVGVLAFLAVFREGAEAVLFIHALAQTADGWSAELLAGLLAAALVLAVLFVAIRLLAIRLPLRAVFLVTSGFLFVMAVKFIGEGLQEFQERQILPYHQVGSGSWVSTLGLNPTLEALLAQGAVVLCAIATAVILHRRAQRATQTTSGRV